MAEFNGHKPNIVDRALAGVATRTAMAVERVTNQPFVAELIGRYNIAILQASVFKSRARVVTVDETVPDYEFWDKLRRGKAVGYSLGSLFARRIEHVIASWVLGLGVTVRLKEGSNSEDPNEPRNYTDDLLAEFIESLLDSPEDDGGDVEQDGSIAMRIYEDMLGLGDQYIIVNADGSLSVPSPDTVTVERDSLDYRQIIKYTVETKTAKQSATDEYTAINRIVTIKEGGKVVEQTTYPNLIGRIPIIHLAHDRSANETFGRSIHENLRPLYDQYDDLIYKQLDGAKLLGNPLLTFVGMEDINEVINANDPATQDTYTDKDGATATRTQLNIDQNAVMLIGKGGDAKFVGPAVGFTADTQQALKSLFLLLLDHTGIPEFIWGNELSSSRSTAEVQLTQFTRDISSRQKQATGWLLKLCTIWLQTQALTDRRIVVDSLVADWPELLDEDRETLLKLVQFAKDRGLLTDKTALELLTLVDNPADETAEAGAELDARREVMFPYGDSADFQARLNGGEEGDDGPNV